MTFSATDMDRFRLKLLKRVQHTFDFQENQDQTEKINIFVFEECGYYEFSRAHHDLFKMLSF